MTSLLIGALFFQASILFVSFLKKMEAHGALRQ
jgi:hypothetical protein